jgi:hypothetical protein
MKPPLIKLRFGAVESVRQVLMSCRMGSLETCLTVLDRRNNNLFVLDSISRLNPLQKVCNKEPLGQGNFGNKQGLRQGGGDILITQARVGFVLAISMAPRSGSEGTMSGASQSLELDQVRSRTLHIP